MKKLLKTSSLLAMTAGVILIIGGLWGICFTYKNVSQENIITPEDSMLPSQNVRGPLTLMAQANIIREHTLKITGGKTYSEMPRQVEKLDSNGKPILDTQGKPVMIPNSARDIWITATALTTALNLGILTYVFSGLVLLIGLISLWNSAIFWVASRRQ